MKKLTPYLFGVATLLLAVGGMALVSWLALKPESPLPTKIEPQKADAIAQELLQAKCAACHGATPEYNSFINFFTGGLLRRDITNARRGWKMEGDSTVRSALVDYLKMDHVLRTRNMPPTQYTFVHLGTRLTPQDVALLRLRYPTNGAEARRFRVISPVKAGDNLQRAQLGYKLFHDPRLSTTNRVSCSSCHDLSLGGTDNKPKSEGVPGADGKPQLGGVNAPTVYNAMGHIRQFWDGRAADLKEQAGGPPLNPVEMGYSSPEDWQKIIAKLAADDELVALFAQVYGIQKAEDITADMILESIAAFEHTLVTPDSAFDRYLMGDAAALDDDQKAGLQAFVNYGCATCHAGPALGGLSFEHINKKADFRAAHAPGYEEGAYGLCDFTKNEEHRDLFRVPTLRNVALTHPYFHTGAVRKLRDAVRVMFQTQAGVTPSADTLDHVTRFLEAQTGKVHLVPLDKVKAEDLYPRS